MSIEQIDVDKVLAVLKYAAATAANEEELRIKASAVLESEVISKLGITPGKYEYTFVSGGRSDALYGHVIIEYKAPGKLSKESDVAKAKEQLIGYIKKEAEVEDRFKLFLGVMLADKIAFVRYDVKTRNWLTRGPYDLNRETVLRLIEAIRGLRRKKLAVDWLIGDFGPRNPMARKAVKIFFNKIKTSKKPKVKALFSDWKRLFSQVCGYSPKKLKGLEIDYGIIGSVDYSVLLFAIHTYYALLMKLLAAEVAYLFGAGKWLKSYVAELEDAHMQGLEALRSTLEDLESGGIFRSLLNIMNFIEEDYFSWYLEEFDKEIANVVSHIAKRLADYEPATPVLEPEYSRDLLKRLYQNLVPRQIRHDLGEYYTPDWLADLVLNEIEISLESFEHMSKKEGDTLAPLSLRVLDPACGSGTFIVLTIKRLKEYAEGHYLRDVLIDYILKNVVGVDLNPLAVLAARTNYLLAIADLIKYAKGPIEIPIYLADSLLVETESTLLGPVYVIRTSVGNFEIPVSIVEKKTLGRLLETADRYVRMKYKPDDFKEVIKDDFTTDENQIFLITKLYENFLRLEKEGKNHVWTSIIRNAFAPLFIGKFDYVVGNPPWVVWENLPNEYRRSLESLLKDYKLWKPGERLGGAEIDISSLFVYRCLDMYLKDDKKFGFLVTQSLFKTRGAGERFRSFKVKRNPIKVLEVHDLVDIKPFEGANNRTSAIMIQKKGKTEYPVKYILWKKKEAIDQKDSLEDAMRKSERVKFVAVPSDKENERSPWITLPKEIAGIIDKVIGHCSYKAHVGISPHGANAVYRLNVLEISSKRKRKMDVPAYLRRILDIKEKEIEVKEIVAENVTERAKQKVKKVTMKLEDFFVFPLIKTRNLNKWKVDGYIYILQMHDPKKRVGYDENWVKISFPKTYGYLKQFEGVIRSRKSRVVRQLMERGAFYSMYGVGEYTFSPYKVVWNRMGSKLVACVIGSINDEFLGKKLMLPEDALAFIPTEDKDEAHFICAILNSSIADVTIRSIASGTKSFGTPKIIENTLKIPGFDAKNKIHRNLSELSKKACKLAAKNDVKNLRIVENEIDKQVARFYGMTDEELERIKAFLEGREIEAEEEIEVPEEVTVDVLNAVVKPNTIGSFEVYVTNPLRESVTIEIQLPEETVKLDTNSQEEQIRVKVPPLTAGEHEISYRVITSKGVAEKKFTLYVKQEKKFRVGETLASKLDELLGEK